eukprot:1148188-Pelagomonas_calceolata.AAC.6
MGSHTAQCLLQRIRVLTYAATRVRNGQPAFGNYRCWSGEARPAARTFWRSVKFPHQAILWLAH